MTTHNYLLYAGYIPKAGLTEFQELSILRIEELCRANSIHFLDLYALENYESQSNYLEYSGWNLRENTGYDFATWSELASQVPTENLNRVIFLNSSVTGPLVDPQSFVLDIISTQYDFLGISESFQITNHYQSFCWSISSQLFTNPVFRNFLGKSLVHDNRDGAISEKELQLKLVLNKLGVTHSSIYPAGSVCQFEDNPSLEGAVKMLNSGFPFLKVNSHGRIDRDKILNIVSTSEWTGRDGAITLLDHWLQAN